MGNLRRTCPTAPRRGPLPKLLWADLFILSSNLVQTSILPVTSTRVYICHGVEMWAWLLLVPVLSVICVTVLTDRLQCHRRRRRTVMTSPDTSQTTWLLCCKPTDKSRQDVIDSYQQSVRASTTHSSNVITRDQHRRPRQQHQRQGD